MAIFAHLFAVLCWCLFLHDFKSNIHTNINSSNRTFGFFNRIDDVTAPFTTDPDYFEHFTHFYQNKSSIANVLYFFDNYTLLSVESDTFTDADDVSSAVDSHVTCSISSCFCTPDTILQISQTFVSQYRPVWNFPLCSPSKYIVNGPVMEHFALLYNLRSDDVTFVVVRHGLWGSANTTDNYNSLIKALVRDSSTVYLVSDFVCPLRNVYYNVYSCISPPRTVTE